MAEPSLDIERHLRYWKMCLRSPLPDLYLSNEGNRMALAYFIINSITILTKPESPNPLISSEDRKILREWVLAHQHPGGGFSGSSSLVFPLWAYDEWDFETGKRSLEHNGLANAAATLFALQLLALLADEDKPEDAFNGVNRKKTLRWLRKLQREDGSFGEALRFLPGQGWFVAGGYDMRYCYIAASIRWMLRGNVEKGDPRWVEDFDVDGLVGYITRSQTYDGGFAGSSSEEPHAGYAYCAVSALCLLSRPPSSKTPSITPSYLSQIRSHSSLLHWLASRPFAYLPPLSTDSDSEEDDSSNFTLPNDLSSLSPTDLHLVGVNGRCNKAADTCYTWWVGASLANLGKVDLINHEKCKRFLLEKMQHTIGGFGKTPGSPPDVYHACFGLAALGVLGEEGINQVDGVLAVPRGTVEVMEKARGRLLEGEKEGGWVGKLGRESVEMGVRLRGERPGWLDGGVKEGGDGNGGKALEKRGGRHAHFQL